jgi:hypothetical protein
MHYKGQEFFYRHIKEVIENATGLRCIRGDEASMPGRPLLGKVHELIEKAEVVVAELSEPRPNVYYEFGYAKALPKEMLVLCREGTDLPLDLKGLEVIEYTGDTADALAGFEQRLRGQLAKMVDRNLRLLQAMLVAPKASPSYILASPRWQVRDAQADLRQKERRTYGDYLGVRGILNAWGALFGDKDLPELISARHADTRLYKADCNLYLIGSQRVNVLVAQAMRDLQKGAHTPWQFMPDETKTPNTTTLVGQRNGAAWSRKVRHGSDVPKLDFGLILRGPHPRHRERQIMVVAGTRSIGTGAACLAATRPVFIDQIRDKLQHAGVALEDKTRTIWVLVSGKPDRRDKHVSERGVKIEEGGVID